MCCWRINCLCNANWGIYRSSKVIWFPGSGPCVADLLPPNCSFSILEDTGSSGDWSSNPGESIFDKSSVMKWRKKILKWNMVFQTNSYRIIYVSNKMSNYVLLVWDYRFSYGEIATLFFAFYFHSRELSFRLYDYH